MAVREEAANASAELNEFSPGLSMKSKRQKLEF